MTYQIAMADSVKAKLKKMIKKDSVTYQRLLKTFDQLVENPYGIGKWMHGSYV